MIIQSGYYRRNSILKKIKQLAQFNDEVLSKDILKIIKEGGGV